jgi:hypothetical protein
MFATMQPLWKINVLRGKLPVIGYDKYIFLTAAEYNGQTDPRKTIGIVHYIDQVAELAVWHLHEIWSLTPIIKCDRIISGIFKPPKFVIQPSNRIKLLVAGLTNSENKDIKGLHRLLENILNKKYKWDVCVQIINYYPFDSRFNKFIKAGILQVYIDVKADKFMSLIANANFVLTIAAKNSTYHSGQLTGIIPLASSFNKTLIMDQSLSLIYKLKTPVITYNFYDPINAVSRGVTKALATCVSKSVCIPQY